MTYVSGNGALIRADAALAAGEAGRKRCRASLATAVQNVTGNLGMRCRFAASLPALRFLPPPWHDGP